MSESKYKVRGYNDIDPRDRARNETERIVCILNPMARAGSAGARVDELKRALERCFSQGSVVVTEGPGHATELAAAAIEDGADIVAAVGGDGTCNEVINGFFDGDRPRRRSAIFSVIPWGTGGDLARSVAAPGRLSEALWIAAMGMTLPTDVGHLRFQTDGGEGERVFINVAGFGANGEVVSRVNRSSKRFGGTASFLGATVATLGSYKPAEVELRWQGEGERVGEWRGRILSCFVANAHYCGGGMYVGRGGSMHDGWLDITALPPLGPATIVAHGWRLYDGSLERVPGVVRARARSVEARPAGASGPPVLLDVDGEQPGRLPATIKVLPKTIQLRGGWLRSPLLDEDRPTWKPGATRR